MNAPLFFRCACMFENAFVVFNVLCEYVCIAYMMQDARITVGWLGCILSLLSPMFNDALSRSLRRRSHLWLSIGILFQLAVIAVFLFRWSRSQVLFVHIRTGVEFDLTSRVLTFATNATIFMCKDMVISMQSKGQRLTVVKSTLRTSKAPLPLPDQTSGNPSLEATSPPQLPVAAPTSLSLATGSSPTVTPAAKAKGGPPSPSRPILPRTIVCDSAPFIVDMNDTVGKRYLPAPIYGACRGIVYSRLGFLMPLNSLGGLVVYGMTNFDEYLYLWPLAFFCLSFTTALLVAVCSRDLLGRLLCVFDVWFFWICGVATIACVAVTATDWRHTVAIFPLVVLVMSCAIADAAPTFIFPYGRIIFALPLSLAFGFLVFGTFGNLFDSQKDFIIEGFADTKFKAREALGGLYVIIFFFTLKNFKGPRTRNDMVMLNARLKYA